MTPDANLMGLAVAQSAALVAVVRWALGRLEKWPLEHQKELAGVRKEIREMRETMNQQTLSLNALASVAQNQERLGERLASTLHSMEIHNARLTALLEGVSGSQNRMETAINELNREVRA